MKLKIIKIEFARIWSSNSYIRSERSTWKCVYLEPGIFKSQLSFITDTMLQVNGRGHTKNACTSANSCFVLILNVQASFSIKFHHWMQDCQSGLQIAKSVIALKLFNHWSTCSCLTGDPDAATGSIVLWTRVTPHNLLQETSFTPIHALPSYLVNWQVQFQSTWNFGSWHIASGYMSLL